MLAGDRWRGFYNYHTRDGKGKVILYATARVLPIPTELFQGVFNVSLGLILILYIHHNQGHPYQKPNAYFFLGSTFGKGGRAFLHPVKSMDPTLAGSLLLLILYS